MELKPLGFEQLGEVLLGTTKLTSVVALKLDPETDSVDPAPEIGGTWGRFSPGIGGMPTEGQLVQETIAGELALFVSLQLIGLHRRDAFVPWVAVESAVEVLIFQAHEAHEVLGQIL